MNPMEKLVDLLDYPETDYWADVLVVEADKILNVDRENMLKEIISCWRTWPENRLMHLAYILGSGSSKLEEELIEQLIEFGSDEVKLTAREAMIEYRS